MYIKELSKEEFDSFCNNFIQSSVYQTSEYASVMKTQGFTTMYVGLIDDRNYIVAASLLLIEKKYGFKYAYAPRGFLMDYTNHQLFEQFTLLLKKYLGKKDIIAVKICPMIVKTVYDVKNNLKCENQRYQEFMDQFKKLGYFHLGFNKNFEALKPRYEGILDISIPYYQIFNNFPKSLRTKIRSSIHRGVSVYRGNEYNLENLYFQTQKKYKRNLKYFESCYANFSKKNLLDYYYTKLDTEKHLTIIKGEYEKQEQIVNRLNQMILQKSTKNKEGLIHKKIKADRKFDEYKKALVKATELLKEYPNGAITSAIIVVKNRDTVSLFVDGHDKTFKEFNSKQLLLWTLIEKYSRLGFKYFNFGGMTDILDEENKYKGLNQFKLNFGCKCYEYVGDFELITNNALYFMYRNSAPIRSILKR